MGDGASPGALVVGARGRKCNRQGREQRLGLRGPLAGFSRVAWPLNIVDDKAAVAHALGETLKLAGRYRLSAYDAAYLELAMRSGLPLATLDADLAKAATTAGVPIFGTH